MKIGKATIVFAGAFLQRGVRPGARRRPLRNAGGLLCSLQSLLRHLLFLPDDGDLPHRCQVQSGLQGAHTQRVSLLVSFFFLEKENLLQIQSGIWKLTNAASSSIGHVTARGSFGASYSHSQEALVDTMKWPKLLSSRES